MSKLWLLSATSLRNQFDLNRWFWESRRSNAVFQSHRAKSVLAVIVIGLGASGVFSLLFFYSWNLGGVLTKYGLLRVLVLQAILFPSVVCFVSGLYSAPGQLFYCKDYDLLLSLPLKISTVLMSKMVNLLLTNSFAAAILAWPPLAVYGLKSGAGPSFWLFAVFAVPFLPVVPLTAASLLALFTGRLAVRYKRSNQVLANLTAALLIMLMLGWFQLSTSNRAAVADANAVLDAVRTWYPPAGLCFDALTGPSLLSLVLFAALSTGALLLFCALFARSFRSILSRLGAASARADYKLQPLAASSALRALWVKEVRGYLGCPIYIMNTLVSMVMLTVFSATMLCVNDTTRAKVLQSLGGTAWSPVFLLLAMAFCATLCCTTAPSISLEGRSLWILKSAPVNPLAIFKAKLLLNLGVSWPFLALNSLLLMAALRLDFGHCLLVWGVSSVYALFIAVAGLVINLHYPKLEFKSPTAVVKQSASVLITAGVSFGAVAAPLASYMWLSPMRVPYELYAALTAALLLGITCLLWLVLASKGPGWFLRLN